MSNTSSNFVIRTSSFTIYTRKITVSLRFRASVFGTKFSSLAHTMSQDMKKRSPNAFNDDAVTCGVKSKFSNLHILLSESTHEVLFYGWVYR